jgi:S1-C subfamily serine protease
MVSVRFVVPPLVESIRYSWFRGQLRAEYEMSTERLNTVSLKSLTEVSRLVSQRVGPSVVHINLLNKPDQERKALLSRLLDNDIPLGQGSGFIIDGDGHIITNHHVIDGVGKIEVSLSDGRLVEAVVIRDDPETDLAILQIDADGLMPITWGNSDRTEVGSPVWAVGSPYGLEQSFTFGILSGKSQ